MNDRVIFDLQCPVSVDLSDFYLNLIDYLAGELRKYTVVEIVNEDILKEFKVNKEIKECERMILHYSQKLDELKRIHKRS